MKPLTSAAFGGFTMALVLVGATSCAEEDSEAAQAPTAMTAESSTEMATGTAQEQTQLAQAEGGSDMDGSAEAAAADGPVYREIIYGDPMAPVTIVEYASLTCSHCAAFHTTVFPEIKKNYIDTGKVRLVFRDFPLDGLAMAGAMLARCAPGDRGQAMLNVMFRQQGVWVTSQSPLEPLTSYAKLAGMSEEDVNACLENQNIMNAIREAQELATNQYKINATPTFFIEDEKVEGGRPYDFISEVINRKLEEKGL